MLRIQGRTIYNRCVKAPLQAETVTSLLSSIPVGLFSADPADTRGKIG